MADAAAAAGGDGEDEDDLAREEREVRLESGGGNGGGGGGKGPDQWLLGEGCVMAPRLELEGAAGLKSSGDLNPPASLLDAPACCRCWW